MGSLASVPSEMAYGERKDPGHLIQEGSARVLFFRVWNRQKSRSQNTRRSPPLEKSSNQSENFTEILLLLEDILERVPARLAEKMKAELGSLREMLMESRAPRLMIIGRRGAGKSSLLNAIFGQREAAIGSVTSETGRAKWYTLTTSRGKLDLLDTRGIGDRTRPESANFNEAIDDIYAAVDSVAPDAILFLCKAKEVDARISEDIVSAKDVVSRIEANHGYKPPVVGIVTQVDELDPLSNNDPPYLRKENNIEAAVDALSKAFRSHDMRALRIMPTSSYAEYENGASTPSFTRYWNIVELVEYLIDVLPKEAQIQFARMSAIRSGQEKVSRILIHSAATLSAGIAAVPIPVADIIPITSLQIGLVTSIGYVSGRALSHEHARDFFAAAGVNVGTSFVLRTVARQLVKVVFPGYGSVISTAIAYAGTWAVGEAAIAYYIQDKDIEEVKGLLGSVFESKKREKESEEATK